MARIAGVNIPTQKRVEIGLRYIHGIGPRKAKEIIEKVGIKPERRVSDLTESEIIQIREAIDRDYLVEGDLRGSLDVRARPGGGTLATLRIPVGSTDLE